MREDHRRDVVVFESGSRFAAEEPVREAPPRGDGHRCEFVARRRHVADGVHVRQGRVLVFVDDDVARLVEGQAGGRLQRFPERFPSDGDQNAVEAVHSRSVARDHTVKIAVCLLDGLDGRLGVQFGTVGLHRLHELVHDERVEAPAQDGVPAEEQVGLRAQGVQDAGHLDGDVPRADDRRLLRLPLQVEEAVGIYRILDPRDRRHADLTAHGDRHLLRHEGTPRLVGAFHHDLVLRRRRSLLLSTKSGEEVLLLLLVVNDVAEGRKAVDDFDVGFLPAVDVAFAEATDVGVPPLLEGAPVKAQGVLLQRVPEALRDANLVAEGLVDARRHKHHLLRHAPDIHARPTGARADALFPIVPHAPIDDRHLRAVARRPLRQCRPPAAATNNDQVVVFSCCCCCC
mmetsp:Transcript_22086/g.71117  ORF Transcript_22086/g.71117 Transcript_22086/m.71117 type:complete len:400 (-) Transcript_22086:162-1361(-)